MPGLFIIQNNIPKQFAANQSPFTFYRSILLSQYFPLSYQILFALKTIQSFSRSLEVIQLVNFTSSFCLQLFQKDSFLISILLAQLIKIRIMASQEEVLKDSLISVENKDDLTDTTATRTQSGKSSMNAVMFGMMASAMGTGIFNLPLRVTQIGLLTFIVYTIASATFSFLGARMLKELVTTLGFDSYGEASQAAYGSALKRVSQFCLILFPWGIAVCFQVILAKFSMQLMADVLGCNFYSDREAEVYNSTGNTVRILLNIVVILVNFILISMKQITIIQKFAIVCVGAVFFNLITICCLFVIGFHHDRPNLDYHGLFHIDWSKVRFFIFTGAESLSQHVQALASVIFCYVNHQLVFPTCKNMEDPTAKRLTTVFFRTNIGEMTVYLLIGISGYLLLVEHEDVEPIGPMVLTTITVWPMTLGKFFMVFALFFAIPLNIFPSRTILFQALNMEKTNKNHYILSIILAASSCAVAIAFQKVNSYFGLLGGTVGVFMAGTIPALCYYKLLMKDDPAKRTASNIAALVFSALITVLACIGAVLSVADPA